MDYTESIKLALEGSVSEDNLRDLLRGCPQICDEVYGKPDIDFAGSGIFISLAIQTALFVVFGVLQTFVSYLLLPRASSSSKLTVARLQVVFDTVYTTGSLLAVATLVASYMRLRHGPSAFERSIMQDMLDVQSILQTLALIAHMVQQSPSGIRPKASRWQYGQVFLTSQAIIFPVKYLKGMSGRLPSAAITRLCSSVGSEPGSNDPASISYPYVHTSPSGTSYVLASLVGVAIVVAILIANEYIRWTIWNWLKKVFTSGITLAILVSSWTLLTSMVLVFHWWQLLYMRDFMFAKAGMNGWSVQWDFAQILSLVFWLPAAYQIVLTLLVLLSPRVGPNQVNRGICKTVSALVFLLFATLCECH